MRYIKDYFSPLGKMILTSDGDSLTGLYFEKQKHLPDFTDYKINDGLSVFALTEGWLDCYFKGDIPDFTPPIHLNGTEFRLRVWDILKDIPYGKTITYGDIANRIAGETGKKMSAQAVGNAVGHNPVSVIIPCHRVLGAGGSLTGYDGGLELKTELLKIEKIL